MNGSSHDIISSNMSFIGNTAPVGGTMALDNGSYQIRGKFSFIDNVATSRGGAVSILDGQHIISGTYYSPIILLAVDLAVLCVF